MYRYVKNCIDTSITILHIAMHRCIIPLLVLMQCTVQDNEARVDYIIEILSAGILFYIKVTTVSFNPGLLCMSEARALLRALGSINNIGIHV